MNVAMLVNSMIAHKSGQKKIACFEREVNTNTVVDQVKEEYIAYSLSILEESTGATDEMH